ncbi:MAG: glycosyltransferase family 4 protein [bacterium]|nr:glycosyltransferase family 4 protein [bacterium]
MKLAIVHPDFKIKGGAENVIFWLCQELSQKSGWEVTVFSVDFAEWKDKLSSISGLRIDTIDIPAWAKNSRLLKLYFAGKSLSRKLDGFDLINPHNYPASLWVGLANIRRGKELPRIIWSCNEPARFLYQRTCNIYTPPNLQVEFSDLDKDLRIKLSSKIKFALKAIYKPLLRRLDKKAVSTFHGILALSNTVSRQVREIYPGSNVTTCYLGVKISDLPSQTNIANSNQIITVSRLESCKNIQNVILAIALLKSHDRLGSLSYAIIGHGPLAAYLRALIGKYRLEKEIKLCGYVSQHELLKYYQQCSGIIYIPYDEPFGLPYLEAALFSKPAIASNHGGPSELVVDGETGFLVDPGNISQIADKIARLHADPKKTTQMGEQARSRVVDLFLWEKYVERYINAVNLNP